MSRPRRRRAPARRDCQRRQGFVGVDVGAGSTQGVFARAAVLVEAAEALTAFVVEHTGDPERAADVEPLRAGLLAWLDDRP